MLNDSPNDWSLSRPNYHKTAESYIPEMLRSLSKLILIEPAITLHHIVLFLYVCYDCRKTEGNSSSYGFALGHTTNHNSCSEFTVGEWFLVFNNPYVIAAQKIRLYASAIFYQQD